MFVGQIRMMFVGVLCSGQKTSSAAAVAETVQAFITGMDALKLNMVAMDQVCGCFSSLSDSCTSYFSQSKCKRVSQKMMVAMDQVCGCCSSLTDFSIS